MDITTILKLVLTTLVRYLVVGACTWLFAHHVFDQGTLQALESPVAVAAIATALATALYGAYLRLKSRFKTNVALALPQGANIADVEHVVSNSSAATIASTAPKQ